MGSVALRNPQLEKEAVAEYGDKIAVGIDALHGKVAAEGWIEQSEVDYIFGQRDGSGRGKRPLSLLIFHDGTLTPNLEMLDQLNRCFL